MSILIKDMQMPKNCKDCPLLGTALNCRILEVAVDGDYYNPDARHEDCPLIELLPHGDLIDACELIKAMPEWTRDYKKDEMLAECLGAIGAMPTIIEAEGEDG